jgi:hypothetical protein
MTLTILDTHTSAYYEHVCMNSALSVEYIPLHQWGTMPGADTTAVRNLLRAVELEIAAEQRADGGNSAKASLTAGDLIGPVDRAGPDGAERREYRYRCGRWPAELDAAADLVIRPAGDTGPRTVAAGW